MTAIAVPVRRDGQLPVLCGDATYRVPTRRDLRFPGSADREQFKPQFSQVLLL
ncbi:hypothetical protein [Kamptonema formosum]|uniref:hypothetical protein n=1 Tax=Kamptonema formosum TaxID=331992 RepID=UPI0012DBEFE9|nr:hypothetical protein [Oscillatoria sp. PCC 10802]